MFLHSNIITGKSLFVFLMSIVVLAVAVLCTPQSAFAVTSIKYGWVALDANKKPILQGSQYPMSNAVKPVKYITDGVTTVQVTPKSVIYLSNSKPGTAQVLVLGDYIVGYKDAFITTFTIIKENTDVSQMSVSGVVNKTYTGSAIEPTITVKNGDQTLKANSDYVVKYDKNTNIGVASVTVTGKGKYTGTKNLSFKIEPADISKASVVVSKKMNYMGKNLKPVPKVTYNKKDLKNGTDFSLSYKNNKKIGNATVIVKGKGNFTGNKSVSFTISKPPKENIVVVSDIHQRTAKLDETLSHWGNIKPVAVINAGDLSELGRKKHFKQIKSIINKHYPGVPQATVLGNHDAHWADNYDYMKGGKDTCKISYTKRDLKYFLEVFGTTNPYVKTTHANIIGLGEPPHYSYRVLTDSNLKLLKTRLNETKREGKWAIVVCHYPGSARGDRVKKVVNVGAKLISILKKYPNVVYVSGHVHEENNAAAVKKRSGVICSTSQSVRNVGESRLFTFSSDGTLTIKRYASGQGTKTLGTFKKK